MWVVRLLRGTGDPLRRDCNGCPPGCNGSRSVAKDPPAEAVRRAGAGRDDAYQL